MEKPYKNLTAAILLGLFLGPIGLLYASFWGGLILFVLLLLTSLLHAPGAVLLSLLIWIICPFWNTFCASKFNEKLLKG